MNWFELVNRATEHIETHISENIILEDIAQECNVSYHYFTKTFSMIKEILPTKKGLYITNSKI